MSYLSEHQLLIQDTLNRVLGDLCPKQIVDSAERGEFPSALWGALSETGLTLTGLPEEHGGSGGDPSDAMLVMKGAGKFSAPIPIAENFLGRMLCSEFGLSAPKGITTFSDGSFSISPDGMLSGSSSETAFGRWSDSVVLIARHGDESYLCSCPCEAFEINEKNNIAGEPRDEISIKKKLLDDQFILAEGVSRRARLLGAASRVAQMSGALESILEMSVSYSIERTQFGKPISKFQAIQQQLATMAGEGAASIRAAQSIHLSRELMIELDVAIAKARVGEAVGICTDIAHQVHGAMGYTLEHSLNHRTRRLWAWRDEFGSEKDWQTEIGRFFSGNASGNLWDQITLLG